jgi:hypothetical protein
MKHKSGNTVKDVNNLLKSHPVPTDILSRTKKGKVTCLKRKNSHTQISIAVLFLMDIIDLTGVEMEWFHEHVQLR